MSLPTVYPSVEESTFLGAPHCCKHTPVALMPWEGPYLRPAYGIRSTTCKALTMAASVETIRAHKAEASFGSPSDPAPGGRAGVQGRGKAAASAVARGCRTGSAGG